MVKLIYLSSYKKVLFAVTYGGGDVFQYQKYCQKKICVNGYLA